MDIIEEFGLNAGRVWNALNICGPLTETQLIEETSLRTNELSAAIGWLSRENKLCKESGLFKLDKTNLTDKIGNNAGKIWQLLTAVEGEVEINHISKMLQIDSRDIYSALGWLAREGKILFKRGKQK